MADPNPRPSGYEEHFGDRIPANLQDFREIGSDCAESYLLILVPVSVPRFGFGARRSGRRLGHAAISVGGISPARLAAHCAYRRRGTARAGADDLVSPVGLDSRRSRSVKASMSSRASNARLRRPRVVCRRTPASTSRGMASLTACALRPMSAEALRTVTTGAPGSASMRRSSADPARTLPRRVRHESCRSTTLVSYSSASDTARVVAAAKSPIQRSRPLLAAGECETSSVTSVHERVEVVP